MSRKAQWKVAGVLGGIFMVLVLIIALAPESEGLPDEVQETPAQAVEKSEDLATIANHSGQFVAWYVDKVTPLCKENYLESYCRVAIYELEKGEPCGLMPIQRINWPAALPDGKFYFVKLESTRGVLTGYRQISSGARYSELPKQEQVFHCWDDLRIMR
jgi:hypothetical protein